jgi:hypothetical protein
LTKQNNLCAISKKLYSTPSTFDFTLIGSNYELESEKENDNTSFINLDPYTHSISNEFQKIEMRTSNSLLDDLQSSNENLPSPLKPTASMQESYHGFSIQGSTIPTIPCSTGDLLFNSNSEEISNN